jgi:hypothetical protein
LKVAFSVVVKARAVLLASTRAAVLLRLLRSWVTLHGKPKVKARAIDSALEILIALRELSAGGSLLREDASNVTRGEKVTAIQK